MGSTKNVNKKLLIAIFTALSLIGSIYSVYSQTTYAQNNAVSSLGSNSIIQEIISSSAKGYSTAGQYFVNFLSIKGIPAYVWTIITFLITTLFFVAIYTYLFEIFIQRTGISESETMKKAKILFIFALSVFSAIAIGYAIPFLLNLYGLILLILVIIALFFFGRAIISYGRSFHYATKSFEVNTKKDLLELERELKKKTKEGELSKEEANQIEEGLKKIDRIYTEADNAFKAADEKFQNILSTLIIKYEEFIDRLINGFENYLNTSRNKWQKNQIDTLENFIGYLKNKKEEYKRELKSELYSSNLDINKIRFTLKEFPGRLSLLLNKDYNNKPLYDDNIKQQLRNILDNAYYDTLSKLKSEIESAINEYITAEAKLKNLYGLEKSLNDIELKVRQLLRVHGDRKDEIAISYALKDLKENIERMKNSITTKRPFLEYLKNLLEKPL